jgi:hypothetical protein
MFHELTSFAVIFGPKLLLLCALAAYAWKLRADVRRARDKR